MDIIGGKFTEMYLGKEIVNPSDKDLLHAQACQLAIEGDLNQAKAMEAKVKAKKEKAKKKQKEGKCKM
jgi:hypothetical protein